MSALFSDPFSESLIQVIKQLNTCQKMVLNFAKLELEKTSHSLNVLPHYPNSFYPSSSCSVDPRGTHDVNVLETVSLMEISSSTLE